MDEDEKKELERAFASKSLDVTAGSVCGIGEKKPSAERCGRCDGTVWRFGEGYQLGWQERCEHSIPGDVHVEGEELG